MKCYLSTDANKPNVISSRVVGFSACSSFPPPFLTLALVFCSIRKRHAPLSDPLTFSSTGPRAHSFCGLDKPTLRENWSRGKYEAENVSWLHTYMAMLHLIIFYTVIITASFIHQVDIHPSLQTSWRSVAVNTASTSRGEQNGNKREPPDTLSSPSRIGR